MTAYRLEVFVLDYDEIGEARICDAIERAHYANDCLHPKVKAVTSANVGVWSDEHPLNKRATADAEYRRVFADKI